MQRRLAAAGIDDSKTLARAAEAGIGEAEIRAAAKLVQIQNGIPTI